MKLYFKVIFIIILFILSNKFCLAASLPTYINATPVPAVINSNNQTFVDQLVTEINKMDRNGDGSLDHLAPIMYMNGGNAGFYKGMLYYISPGDVIGTLSRAYTYLPTALKTKVKTYLDAEIASYSPLSMGYYSPNAGTIGQFAGSRREYNPINPAFAFNIWPGPTVGIEIAYPLYLYTNTTGDRRFIDTTGNWNSLVSLYNSSKSSGIKYYPQLSGIIGFARLAKLKGDAALSLDATNLANQAVTSTGFNSFVTNSNNQTAVNRQTMSAFIMGNNTSDRVHYITGYFTPEIGWYLGDNEKSALTVYAESYELNNPLWYMTMPGWDGDRAGVGSRENLFAPIEIGWSLFMIHAYGFREPMSQISKYIDFPPSYGDLFFMQELVAAIEAPQDTVPPSPSPSPSISPSPSPSFTIANLKTLLINWLTVSDSLYYHVDGKVNSLDASYVMKWISL